MSMTPQSAESAEGETAQVLTFGIGEQDYCIDLEYVTEIVDGGQLTAVPNTPEHVEGVMDLRGQTTTIVNPLVLLEGGTMDPDDLVTDGGENTHRIIMLDSDLVDSSGAVGWLVSTVSAVTEIPVENLDAEGVTDADMFRGVVKRENSDGFLIWLDPEELTA